MKIFETPSGGFSPGKWTFTGYCFPSVKERASQRSTNSMICRRPFSRTSGTFSFARSTETGRSGEIKGSGRSISGFHLRDALDLVSKRAPGLLTRFGGHAMAAGLTLAEADLPQFVAAFEAVAGEWLTAAQLQRVLETDGSLDPDAASLEVAQALRFAVWGQGFPAPSFDDTFTVLEQRLVGGRHLRLRLERETGRGRARYDAIAFNQSIQLPPCVHAVYRLEVNDYQGAQTMQLLIEHWAPA